MGGRGSNNMARIKRGGNTKQKPLTWKRRVVAIRDRANSKENAYVDSNDRYAVYKDAGGRFRVYDMKKKRTVDQGGGVDLVFNRLKDAKEYASKK